MIIEIVIGILSYVISFLWIKARYFKPIIIKYDIAWSDWIVPNTLAFASLMFLMLAEMKNYICMEPSKHSNSWIWFRDELVINGIILLFIIYFIKRLHSWWVRFLGLDRTSAFSENISKIFLTVASIFCCILIWMVIWPYWNSELYVDVTPYVSRIIAWIINILGIWLDFGVKKKKSITFTCYVKEVLEKVKKHLKYYIGFVLSMLLPCVLIIMYGIDKVLTEYILDNIIVGMLIACVTIWGMNFIYLHGAWRSDFFLKYNLTNILMKNINYVKGNYGRVTYLLLKDNEYFVVVVVGQSVIWEHCEKTEQDAIDKLFKQSFWYYGIGKDVEQLYAEIKLKLEDISNGRKEFLLSAHEKEKERWEIEFEKQ